jgi:hypothetical protein
MDGVILVVRPGFTRADVAANMLEQLGRVNARIMGVVLNRSQRHSHYYSYKYGEYYNQSVPETHFSTQVERAPIRPSPPQTKTQPAMLPVQQVEALGQEDSVPEIVRESVEVSSVKNIPATHTVQPRPSQKTRPRQPMARSAEPARAADSESRREESLFREANEYVILNYNLEYWIMDEQESRG